MPGSWLDELFLRPDYRRYGLGRELLDALRARTNGRVEWDLRADNEKAEAFYAELGAEPVLGPCFPQNRCRSVPDRLR